MVNDLVGWSDTCKDRTKEKKTNYLLLYHFYYFWPDLNDLDFFYYSCVFFFCILCNFILNI